MKDLQTEKTNSKAHTLYKERAQTVNKGSEFYRSSGHYLPGNTKLDRVRETNGRKVLRGWRQRVLHSL